MADRNYPMENAVRDLSMRMKSPIGRDLDAPRALIVSDSVPRGYEYMMGKEAPAHLGSQSESPTKDAD